MKKYSFSSSISEPSFSEKRIPLKTFFSLFPFPFRCRFTMGEIKKMLSVSSNEKKKRRMSVNLLYWLSGFYKKFIKIVKIIVFITIRY